MKTIKTVIEGIFLAILGALCILSVIMIMSEPSPDHFMAGMLCKAGGVATIYLIYKGVKSGFFERVSEAINR